MTLVRRGYRTVEAAREFLEAGDEHDPLEFDGMEDVVELALGHARRGARVTIHGDYDVDGVTSTAILVSTLRALGAECDWLIPDRMGDGYGLSAGSVEQLKRTRDRAGDHGRLRDRLGRGGRGAARRRDRRGGHRPPRAARRSACPTARSCTRS